MLTTEAEAKTKRCQEGYAASPGASVNPSTDFVGQSSVMPPMMHSVGAGYGAAVTMTTTAAPATAPIFCLGSACMAWRWSFVGNPISGIEQTDRGYCGKAGEAAGIIER